VDSDSSSSSSDSIESPIPAKPKDEKHRAVRKLSWLLSKQPVFTPKSKISEATGADKEKDNGDSDAGGALTAMPNPYTPGMTISGKFVLIYIYVVLIKYCLFPYLPIKSERG